MICSSKILSFPVAALGGVCGLELQACRCCGLDYYSYH